MNYKEFGSKGSKTIFFLHGGGLSWWNYREEAEMLKNEYHIIVPILDGHAGSDRHFSTIESNAQDIALFINENLGGSVFMLCGLSLGGQILLEMLSQQGDICDHAIIESAPAIPSMLTNALIRPAIGCSYPLIKQKWFAKMQFSQLKIKS
ncbi:MAG: alpha/beta hydrolase, partial [Ruminococcus sp.]|nr:alpha/beta hydrolase [Ruminococcus sp.]